MTIAAFLTTDQWLHANGGPRYVQLGKRLAQAVDQDLLNVGDQLPPEREIAAITGFSRVTVRKAIQALAEDGIIIQKQGSGSFVASKTPQLEQSLSRLTSFSEDMSRRRMNPASIWLERGIYMPSPDEVLALALSQDASVSRLARLRTANSKPMAIEHAALSTDVLPDPFVVETSLYDVLEQTGHRPVRALQKISAINLGPEDAALLEVNPEEAALRIERTSYLADGRTIEYTQSTYRGDSYNFVAELRLAKE